MNKDSRLLVALGVTGAAALALEVIWSRALIPWAGGMAMAQVATVGVYMLGLFAGSVAASFFVDRIRDPRSVFIRVEAAAALVSILMILGLPFADPIFRLLAQGSLLSGPLGAGLRGLAGGSLIFPATFLMGFGFPMAIVAYQSRGAGAASVAWIYGINTTGAAFGAFLGGFVLLPGLGIIWASLLVVVVDLLVLFWAKSAPQGEAEVLEDESNEANSEMENKTGEPSARFEQPAMLVAVFVGGFVALGLEVMLFRVLGLILGPTARAFTVVVTSYVLGLGLGALSVGPLIKKGPRVSRIVFMASWFAAGLLVLCVHVALGILPRPLSETLASEGSSLSFQLSVKALSAAVILVPLTAAFGAAFAGAVAAVPRASPRRAALLYASLTLGNVLGLLAAAIWILPQSGLEGGLILLGQMALLVPIIALAGSGYRKRTSMGMIALAAIAAVVGPQVIESWNWKNLNSGPYLYRSKEINAQSRIFLLLRHGFGSTVAVMKEKEKRYFTIDGKVDGSNTKNDMVTQSLPGLMGPLLHPNPKKALVIGLGTGQTVAEVLRFPLQSVECAEILPAIWEILPFFKDINRNFWTDRRYSQLRADGRTILRYGPQDYDIIISEPTNVWVPGVAQLFTREAFVEARESLRAPSGIFCQWIHTYRLDPEAFRMVLRAFLDVFPHTALWTTSMDNYDVLMVGSLEPLGITQADLDERLEQAGVNNYRTPGTLLDSSSFLRTYIAQTADLKASIGPGKMLRQSRPRLEYMAEKMLHQDSQGAFDQWLLQISKSSAELLRGTPDSDFLKSLDDRRDANLEIRKLLLQGLRNIRKTPEQAKALLEKLEVLIQRFPDDLELRRVASRFPFESGEALVRTAPRGAAIYFSMTLKLWPGHKGALKNLTILAMERRDFAEAHRLQREYARADPSFMPTLILADIQRAQGRYKEAAATYQRVLEEDPKSLQSLGSLVTCFVQQGMAAQALATLANMLELDPGNSFAVTLMEKMIIKND